jgi:hypothetical protein
LNGHRGRVSHVVFKSLPHGPHVCEVVEDGGIEPHKIWCSVQAWFDDKEFGDEPGDPQAKSMGSAYGDKVCCLGV